MGHLGGLKRLSLCMLEKINNGKEGKDWPWDSRRVEDGKLGEGVQKYK